MSGGYLIAYVVVGILVAGVILLGIMPILAILSALVWAVFS
jgi:hypothetical protein